MPFSFNPTAQAGGTQEGGNPSAVGVAPQNSPDISINDAPSVPDTPFLFLQQRGTGTISMNAYLQMLLVLICVLTVVSSITLFAYGMYLSSSIESKKEQLAAQEASFKEYPFDDMRKLSDKVNLVGLLLKDYISIRSPLKLLEDVVENKAYFDNFSLAKEKKGGYIASFNIVTSEYEPLIQQLEALKLTQYTKIAPQPKTEKLIDNKKQTLMIRVTTPIIVQGVLPDEVVFLSSSTASPRKEETSLVSEEGATSASSSQQ
ncbi:MAG: hypothetical protein KBC21_03425 [Candidatus Pacebacteria bacterium]|nr:hypothetical protein [Candidatus Paceibacterota bacterium]